MIELSFWSERPLQVLKNDGICSVQNGEKAQKPQEIECPPGWIWEDDWNFDINRAVDEKGQEFWLQLDVTEDLYFK